MVSSLTQRSKFYFTFLAIFSMDLVVGTIPKLFVAVKLTSRAQTLCYDEGVIKVLESHYKNSPIHHVAEPGVNGFCTSVILIVMYAKDFVLGDPATCIVSTSPL